MKPIDSSSDDREYQASDIPSIHATFDMCVQDFSPYIKSSKQWSSKLAYGLFKAVNLPIQKKLARLQKEGPLNWFNESIEQLYLECREGLPFFNHFSVVLNSSNEKSYAEKVANIINATRSLVTSTEKFAGFFKGYRKANPICDTCESGFAGNHFILLSNGRAYAFQNQPVSVQNIDAFLHAGISTSNEDDITFGHLSACRREEWYRLEEKLSDSTEFSRTLLALRNAKFIICLDLADAGIYSSIKDEQFKFRSIHNRFFDKAVQIVIDHQQTYLLFEHARVDGKHAVELCDGLAKRLESADAYAIEDAYASYEQLDFSPGIKLRVSERKNILSYIVAKKTEFCWRHEHYSEFDRIFFEKSRLPVDSVLQMAVQLAYYRCTQNYPSIYEPVSLQHIPGRRLDFISSFSSASRDFIEASTEADFNRATISLKDAILQHKKSVKRAKQGHGSMSHILALSSAEFSHNKSGGIRIQRRRKSVLSKVSKAFRYLIKRDVMASNGSGSNHVALFGTIIHQADMLGIGYLVNHHGLSVDIQVHGQYKTLIDPQIFLSHLADSILYIACLLYEPEPPCKPEPVLEAGKNDFNLLKGSGYEGLFESTN